MTRFAKAAGYATLMLVAASCAEHGAEADGSSESARAFPTADARPGSDAMAPPDTTATPDAAADSASDAGPAADSAPARPADALPPTGPDVESVDAAIDHDTHPADTGSPDVAPPMNGGCDPSGTWTLNIVSAALPGEGCSEGGQPAQEDTSHTLTVTPGGQGTYVATLKDQDDPAPTIKIKATGAAGLCKVSVTITVAVVVPGAGDVEGGTASLIYVYDLKETAGAVVGAGDVTTSFVTESNKVLAQCTEDLSVAGAFAPK